MHRFRDVHWHYDVISDVTGDTYAGDFVNGDDDGCSGIAVNKAYKDGNGEYLYNIFMRKADWRFSLAHEIGHILTDGGHFGALEAEMTDQPNRGIYRTNLMYDGMLFDGSLFDGKRLLDIQETSIHRSRYAIPIEP